MEHAQSKMKTETGKVMDVATATSEEVVLRAGLYRLVAHFLSAPPTDGALAAAAAIEAEPGTPLGGSLAALAAAAGLTSAAAEADAYQTLFIGLGRGLFVPYGSYYLTGFLHEKPLARLRHDMAELGIEREEGVSEPEDHISSVLEIMAGLVDSTLADVTEQQQRRFFEAHVATWAGHFFSDLAANEQSRFYAALGEVGATFLGVEERASRMT